jgi:hypothetical protein
VLIFSESCLCIADLLVSSSSKGDQHLCRVDWMQRKWYPSVLEKDIDAVNGKYDATFCSMTSHNLHCRSHGKEGGKTRLIFIICEICHYYGGAYG